ncbi:uncharacterized protein ASCRUDRAFT_145816 [Ascoidea rubescens DSM 1968]|uniref:Uncharacterized protein n=1 Tax=Ascoidea rubescens DSM 1968 TaxID=1344418 RepID=A0A1D2VHC5_9ASCO|nr:hypothetical protein ASCRUDRAFT_145816 [Ascoidea rubescens DSM 1968]ODV61054.1 hypothetical protein ASCRUDRAFT_145816 [Ascoidea rubescens DSM 1968]
MVIQLRQFQTACVKALSFSWIKSVFWCCFHPDIQIYHLASTALLPQAYFATSFLFVSIFNNVPHVASSFDFPSSLVLSPSLTFNINIPLTASFFFFSIFCKTIQNRRFIIYN